MIDVRRVDLHTHTTCSDGALTPEALVARAAEAGLQAVAVTDHDCIDGLASAEAAAQKAGLEVVPGVELSVTVDEVEVHLLGYFFDREHAGINEHLSAFLDGRTRRAERMVEQLSDLGVPVMMEDVHAMAGGRALGRPHVARALVEAGHVETAQEAFQRFIGDGGPAHVGKPRFPAAEALALLHDAGGIGVLAHPGHWTRDTTLMALIRAGLDGIETVHPSHDYSLTRYYRTIAHDFGLVETGGSDYHGPREDGTESIGRYSIPYPWYVRTRERANRASLT